MSCCSRLTLPRAEPDWVVAHDNEKRRQALLRYETELKERIARAREAQAREKKRAAAQAKKSEGSWKKKAVSGARDVWRTC